MPNTRVELPVNYGHMRQLTGLSEATLRSYASQGLWNPENLESIVLFLCRHAKVEMRQKMLLAAITKQSDVRRPKKGTPKRGKPSRSRV